jgi:hypothetical protein
MNIDRIAREMVDVEPSLDLEARIRARIREAAPAQTAWWTWRIAAPLGAIASLAIAFMVVQGPGLVRRSAEREGGSGVQSPVTRVAVQEVGALPSVAAPAGALSKAGPGVVKTSQRRKSPASVLSAEELAWMERRLPALDPVNALQVDHLRMDSIQPEPLAITPLTMTPVGTEGAGIERRNDR